MGRRVESESESLRRNQMKKLVFRPLLVAFSIGVGVLTMPLWPVFFADLVWNSFDDEDEL